MASQNNMQLKRKSLAREVSDELRRRILSGELPEGAQLLQEALAAEFGISKVPVREALFQLEAEGFVVQHFHRGAVVASSSSAQMLEFFELRARIEVWLLEMAMPAAEADDIARAKSLASQFDEAKDPVLAWDLNWRFHEALYIPANKPFSIEYLRKLHALTGRYVILQDRLAVDRHQGSLEHHLIIERYERKDRLASDVLRDHLLTAAHKLRYGAG